MADSARAARMAKRIQQIVARALEHNTRDRRLELITITDCRLTGDLHDATLYYTVRGRTVDEEPDTQAAARALARLTGQLRSTVGAQLGVRFTPTVRFVLDTLPEGSAHFEDLLAKARARDAEIARAAQGATPAGDADPYKKPAAADSEASGNQAAEPVVEW